MSNQLARNKNAKLYFVYLPEYLDKLDYNYKTKTIIKLKNCE